MIGIAGKTLSRALRISSKVSYNAAVQRYKTTSRLAQVAEDQWGLLTRRQAESAGVSQATFQRLVRGSVLERVAHGVYHLTGAPTPDHVELRAAWLQLAPDTSVWERTPDQGVVSHRSAAAMYGLGHLAPDRHDFTLPGRRQSRRPDVRLHQRRLTRGEWVSIRGLLVTRPSRIASDLLSDHEDPEAVAHVIADALRGAHDDPGGFTRSLAPYAAQFGLRRRDGLALLGWLLDLIGDPDASMWVEEGRRAAGPCSSFNARWPTTDSSNASTWSIKDGL